VAHALHTHLLRFRRSTTMNCPLCLQRERSADPHRCRIPIESGVRPAQRTRTASMCDAGWPHSAWRQWDGVSLRGAGRLVTTPRRGQSDRSDPRGPLKLILNPRWRVVKQACRDDVVDQDGAAVMPLTFVSGGGMGDTAKELSRSAPAKRAYARASNTVQKKASAPLDMAADSAVATSAWPSRNACGVRRHVRMRA